MRYHGQGHEIEIAAEPRAWRPKILMHCGRRSREYSRQFSRTVPEMSIEILNWALSLASAFAAVGCRPVPGAPSASIPDRTGASCAMSRCLARRACCDRDALAPGDTHRRARALIIEPQTTTLVSADFEARVDGHTATSG
jgi:N-methylhydantoinase A